MHHNTCLQPHSQLFATHNKPTNNNYSGAPVAPRAAKHSIITIGTELHACTEIENHASLLFMVTNMSRDIDRWHVHQTAMSHNKSSCNDVLVYMALQHNL